MASRIARLCIGLGLFALFPFGASAQVSDRPRVITPIRGDVYQVRDGDQVTVFLATPDGIVLVDPLNRNLAIWLKAELEERFPGRTVRYVLHSSHLYERAAGGSLFNDTAEIVAHDDFLQRRERADRSLPASWAPLDRNENAILERSEVLPLGEDAARNDRNSDGEITPAEAWGEVASPESTFSTRHVVELGGRRVELIHPGNGLGGDVTVVLFPAERLLFAPGVPLGEAPASFAAAPPSAFIDTLREIERLDFDTVLSESGEMRTVADLALVREYVEAMMAGVEAGVRGGDTVEQLQAALELQRFSGLRNFATRRGQNIADVYGRFRVLTVSVSGAGQYVQMQRGVPGCRWAGFGIEVGCVGIGGRSFAGTGGVSFMVGRVGGVVEFSATSAFKGSDQEPFSRPVYLHEYRERALSLLFRYDAVQARPVDVAVLAGLANIWSAQRTNGGSAFFSGLPTEDHDRDLTPVFGADLATTAGGLRFISPVRFIRSPSRLFYGLGVQPTRWQMRVGLGITVPLARLVP